MEIQMGLRQPESPEALPNSEGVTTEGLRTRRRRDRVSRLARRKRGMTSYVFRLLPFGSFAALGTVAAVNTEFILAALLGTGAVFTGRRLMDREANARRELGRRVRANVAELRRVARQDRVSAPQMENLIRLQEGVLESWNLLPTAYRPLLDEDIFTIVEEVETTAHLARRRSALRRHLESVDRTAIHYRVVSLEHDLAALPLNSVLRRQLEFALAGRREELDGVALMTDGISVINAQLEGAESLLANLRGELLALDPSLSPSALESGLVHLKERVAYFRRGLDEVTRAVDPLEETLTRELPIR
jgi:hypothetical protein